MPFAQIKIIENVFDDQKKQEIIKRVTEALVSVEGEGLREKTVVVVEEVKSGNWAVGGHILSTQDVKKMAAASTP